MTLVVVVVAMPCLHMGIGHYGALQGCSVACSSLERCTGATYPAGLALSTSTMASASLLIIRILCISTMPNRLYKNSGKEKKNRLDDYRRANAQLHIHARFATGSAA